MYPSKFNYNSQFTLHALVPGTRKVTFMI